MLLTHPRLGKYLKLLIDLLFHLQELFFKFGR